MVDFASVHPLGDLDTLKGDGSPDPGVAIAIRHDFECAQVFSRNGKEKSVATKLKLGSKPGEATETAAFSALPLAPGQWTLISKKSKGGFTASLAKKLAGIGYASEQGNSRVCFRVSGRDARELMARGCRLDLHGSVVSKGYCTQTPMAQVGVILHQVDDAPTYDLYVYSGFARSFWHWLSHSAAQFGYSVN